MCTELTDPGDLLNQTNGEVTVKNMLIATAVAAALYLPAGAGAATTATSEEIASVRDQLRELVQRVDKLEQENTELKSENDSLKNQTDYLKAETKGLRKDSATAAADLGKVKGTDWASRISLKGDLRYRYEMIDDELANSSDANNARYRDRIRARLGLDAKVTDTLSASFQLATGGDDPRSSNQTLSGEFTRKSIGLDLAYFDWKFANWGTLTGGKMKYPFVRPGQSLFYDGDVNPEGLAMSFNRGIFFANAYDFWLEEKSTAADSMIYGAQLGARLPIGGSSLMLAVNYNDLVKGQGYRPFYNCPVVAGVGTPPVVPGLNATQTIGCANGNTLSNGNQNTATLAYDFNIIELAAEWTTTLGKLPFQLWANAAENQDPDDLNTAWGAGAVLGKASNSKTWEIGLAYQSIEKNALFGQWVDSDFGDGKTDAEGFFLKAGYAPIKNWTLNATYFVNERQTDVGPESDYDRLQVDFNLKF
jgi:cell division protein FtsB